MIDQITIENFKCFKNAKTITFSDLTLMSGLNNSGKSSIYQFLLLLKQSRNSTWESGDSIIPSLRLNGSILQLGNPGEIINDISKGFISITIKFIDQITLSLEYRLIQEEDFQLNYDDFNPVFALSKTTISTDDYSYTFEMNCNKYFIKAHKCLSFENSDLEKHLNTYLTNKTEKNNIPMDRYDYLSSIVEFNDIESITFSEYYLMDLKLNISNIINCIDKKYHSLFDIKEFHEYLIERKYNDDYFVLNFEYHFRLLRFTKSFRNIFFIPPFRGFPMRIYNDIDSQNPLKLFVAQQKKMVYYKFENNNKISGSLEDALKYWIPQIISDIDSFKINNLVDGLASETLIESKKISTSINNVGFGISQVLPLILDVLLIPEKSICIIDEPEIHLHPAIQTKLADFFNEMINLDKKIIIETHSEYVINRTLYHKMISNNKTLEILWIVKNEFESEIIKMEYDSLGFILNRPRGFLDEGEYLTQQFNDERSKRL